MDDKQIKFMDKERMEILHKEIDTIQLIIGRMQNNSFLLKAWTVSLIAVLLALTKDTLVATDLSYFNFVLLFPLLLFWYLDAFFLHKERCYRKLYDWVVANRKNSDEHLYSLDYRIFTNEVPCIAALMFRNTLLLFYGGIAIVVLSIAVYNLIA